MHGAMDGLQNAAASDIGDTANERTNRIQGGLEAIRTVCSLGLSGERRKACTSDGGGGVSRIRTREPILRWERA